MSGVNRRMHADVEVVPLDVRGANPLFLGRAGDGDGHLRHEDRSVLSL